MGKLAGLQNIFDVGGFAIALSGMLIVFCSLVLVSLFIALLPRILPHSAAGADIGPLETAANHSDNMPLVAALGYALHLQQRESDKP